jgi:hypothetical protein
MRFNILKAMTVKSTNFRDSALYGLVVYHYVAGMFVTVLRGEE